MKYRKKPIIVEAEQWYPGENIPGVQTDGTFSWVVTIHNQKSYLEPGDYVIREPDGIHYYPCKPEVFRNTYEKVE